MAARRVRLIDSSMYLTVEPTEMGAGAHFSRP